MTTTTTDLATIANEALSSLEQRTRDNGETFWSRKDGSPDWVQSLCHDAHGDMTPDDHRYSFIVEALAALAEGDEDADTIEADCYTSDLTGWLHSRPDRFSYCDQAVGDGYGFTDTVALLSMGQSMEKREVFELVKANLESRLEEIDG